MKPVRAPSRQVPEDRGHHQQAQDCPRRVLVLGLGNPILGDDGVGWAVAEQVEAGLPPGEEVEVDRVSLGGLGLMERMLDYDRVVLIDAMWSGEQPPGAVTVHPLQELPNPGAGHTTAAHDASLRTALETAQRLGAAVPRTVEVVAIETEPCYEFSESLSRLVAESVPIATRKVLGLVG